MRFVSPLIFTLIFATSIPAQTSFSGPVEAVTYDAPTRSIRAVIGLPGAASFGPALLDNVDFASIAPHQNYGIVFVGQKWLYVQNLNAAKISAAPIDGLTGSPQGVVWSADGSHAILYSRAGGWFQTIAGFPNAPAAGSRVSVSSLGGSLSALATDSAGKQIALAVTGDHAGVYQFADGQFTPLISVVQPISLSFSSDGQTVYALDAATSEVTAAKLNGGGNQIVALSGIANPIAIQALLDSQNRQLLYVAGGSDRILRILDIASQQTLSDISLPFQPTDLAPFGTASFVLACRSKSASPLWLYSSSAQSGAYFVPAMESIRAARRSVDISGRSR